jgi:hypothetical protein
VEPTRLESSENSGTAVRRLAPGETDLGAEASVASLCNYPSSSPSVLIQHVASWIEPGTSASRRYSRSPGLLTAKIDWGDAHAEPVAQILANAVRGSLGVGGQANNGPGRRRRQQLFDHLGVTPRPHSTNPFRSGRRPATGTTRLGPGSATWIHQKVDTSTPDGGKPM